MKHTTPEQDWRRIREIAERKQTVEIIMVVTFLVLIALLVYEHW